MTDFARVPPARARSCVVRLGLDLRDTDLRRRRGGNAPRCGARSRSRASPASATRSPDRTRCSFASRSPIRTTKRFPSLPRSRRASSRREDRRAASRRARCSIRDRSSGCIDRDRRSFLSAIGKLRTRLGLALLADNRRDRLLRPHSSEKVERLADCRTSATHRERKIPIRIDAQFRLQRSWPGQMIFGSNNRKKSKQ